MVMRALVSANGGDDHEGPNFLKIHFKSLQSEAASVVHKIYYGDDDANHGGVGRHFVYDVWWSRLRLWQSAATNDSRTSSSSSSGGEFTTAIVPNPINGVKGTYS